MSPNAKHENAPGMAGEKPTWEGPPDAVKDKKKNPKGDAEGQFRKSQHGSHNDGVSSADPKVLSGKKSGDATFGSGSKS